MSIYNPYNIHKYNICLTYTWKLYSRVFGTFIKISLAKYARATLRDAQKLSHATQLEKLKFRAPILK